MKRRGRPRVDETDLSQLVTITLPRRQFDRLCQIALRNETSVPALIRKAIERQEKTTKK